MLFNGNIFENSIHTSIRRSVNILNYMNTIDDMQNEMDFFHRCKKIEYSHDFVIFF